MLGLIGCSCVFLDPMLKPKKKKKNLAAVAWGAGQPLVIEEVEVSPPQPQEIRIKVIATSLCGSDVSAWESQVTSSPSSSFLFLLFVCQPEPHI